MNTLASILPLYMARLSACMIALMPFHAFLTVWLASLTGGYTTVRLWKEFVLLALFVGALFLFMTQQKVRRWCRQEVLIPLIAAYILLLLLVGGIALAAGAVSTKAYAYGALLDSRFLIFFAITWLASHYSDVLTRLWKRLLLVPAGLAVGFATLQYTLLPADFLRHFGYGPDTISPSATIDQKDAYRRIQSTLRGPNPFGAYLVVILSALGAIMIRTRKLLLYPALFYILSGLALVFTFSRSAWIGALLATVWLIWCGFTAPSFRRWLVVAGCIGAVSFAGVFYTLRNNDHFQNIFFHTNEHSRSVESSNTGHAAAIQRGLQDIFAEPWGRGAGTAGPASVYNDGRVRIAENYYAQLGQEAGVAGLGLFIALNIVVLKRLWARRDNTLSLVLIASFIGITAINMLMHAWADDTLAYIWWGLAGAAVALPGGGKRGEVAG